MGDIGPNELRQMQSLAQEVTAGRPELLNGDATIGELAWVWGKDYDQLGEFWRHRMWFDDEKIVGWGWVCLPYEIPLGDGTVRRSKLANLTWQTKPDRPDLVDEVLGWYEEVAGDADQYLILQSEDPESVRVAKTHGYEIDEDELADDGEWVQFNSRDLNDLREPKLPIGFRFLTAEDVSVADAVQAHHDAWQTARLSEAAVERVQRTWPYRRDLHVFVQAPDNTLAATAIIWFDELTKTAEFEPVGTHIDFRRLGLGTALQLHGMQRAKEAGATRMFVACIGAPGRPAAKAMYYGVGFRELTRDVPMIKTKADRSG